MSLRSLDGSLLRLPALSALPPLPLLLLLLAAAVPPSLAGEQSAPGEGTPLPAAAARALAPSRSPAKFASCRCPGSGWAPRERSCGD